jgi:hypothetical protein
LVVDHGREVEFLKKQIAELDAQKGKFEELYNNLRKENQRNTAELK